MTASNQNCLCNAHSKFFEISELLSQYLEKKMNNFSDGISSKVSAFSPSPLLVSAAPSKIDSRLPRSPPVNRRLDSPQNLLCNRRWQRRERIEIIILALSLSHGDFHFLGDFLFFIGGMAADLPFGMTFFAGWRKTYAYDLQSIALPDRVGSSADQSLSTLYRDWCLHSIDIGWRSINSR